MMQDVGVGVEGDGVYVGCVVFGDFELVGEFVVGGLFVESDGFVRIRMQVELGGGYVEVCVVYCQVVVLYVY